MEKGLLFMTLSVLCLWILLDEFFGTKKLSKVAESLTPDVGLVLGGGIPLDTSQEEKDEAAKDIKDKIDKNKDLKDKIKDDLKKGVDHFYGPANPKGLTPA